MFSDNLAFGAAKEFDKIGEMFLVDQLSNFSVSNTQSATVAQTPDEVLQKQRQREIAVVVNQHEKERADATFSKICLLCRECISGTRHKVMLHFYEVHEFYIGSEEIVFVDEYLDHIDYKLMNSECFFCEKRYDNWVMLKEHMEIKKHWRLNPANPFYNKFFLSSYTEPEKRYRDIKKTQEYVPKPEDQIELTRSEKLDAVCLFCNGMSKQVDEVIQHMKETHYFDLHKINELQQLNFSDKKKIIYHIRAQVSLHKCSLCGENFPGQLSLLQHLTLSGHSGVLPPPELYQDTLFFPMISEDKLIYSLEDFFIHKWR